MGTILQIPLCFDLLYLFSQLRQHLDGRTLRVGQQLLHVIGAQQHSKLVQVLNFYLDKLRPMKYKHSTPTRKG